MLEIAPATGQLEAEIAVAIRLIRSGSVPREFFCWLSQPSESRQPPMRFIDERARQSMDAILEPVFKDANSREQHEARQAALWLSSISLFVADRYKSRNAGFAIRLLATSLLPLYRTLATGKLREGFEQTRYRLTENLLLLGLCDELGDELMEILESAVPTKQTPATLLLANFNLALVSIGYHVRRAAAEFDSSCEEFSAEFRQEIMACQTQASMPQAAEWASPDLLWRLAGELIAKKSEMVLPRAWIETPVPWSSISDHWNAFAHLLSTIELPPEIAGELQPPAGQVTGRAAGQRTRDAAHGDSGPRSMSAAAGESIQPASPPRELNPYAGGHTHGKKNSCAASGVKSPESDAEELEILAPVAKALEQLVAEHAGGDLPVAGASAKKQDPFSLPKVIIAEIRSHNDPVFVNVLKRQIANCRTEDRTVCLATVVVVPEDDVNHQEVCGVRENGLTLWQQKLVSWLADHPHVVDPYAFLTCDGELILCLLDVERNEMTRVLRQGLVEVLTGKRIEPDSDMSLSKVHVPARFYAGIASTSSPGANLTAEQLLEPAIRCLSAAKRHGKASIKSIEVF